MAELDSIKCGGKPLYRLIKPLLDFTADHHTHHHIKLGVENHTDAGISWGNLVELNPKGEVNRYTALVASDFDMLAIDLVNHTQLYGKALNLK